MHIDRGVPIWGTRWVADILKSVYPTLVLGFLKSGSFNITVKDESTIGASGMIPSQSTLYSVP